jgi:hypothetical protein
MVSPIDAGIAGTTEFILKLQTIPETKNIFSIINIKTKFDKPVKKSNDNLLSLAFNIIEEVPVFEDEPEKVNKNSDYVFKNRS